MRWLLLRWQMLLEEWAWRRVLALKDSKDEQARTRALDKWKARYYKLPIDMRDPSTGW